MFSNFDPDGCFLGDLSIVMKILLRLRKINENYFPIIYSNLFVCQEFSTFFRVEKFNIAIKVQR
jgi:hypothetical protein